MFGVSLRVVDAVGEAELDTNTEVVADGDRLNDGVAEFEGVAELDSDALAGSVLVGDSDTLAGGEVVSDAVALEVRERAAELDCDALAGGEEVGNAVALEVSEPLHDRDAVAEAVDDGVVLPLRDAVGVTDSDAVTDVEPLLVRDAVEEAVSEGDTDGDSVGDAEIDAARVELPLTDALGVQDVGLDALRVMEVLDVPVGGSDVLPLGDTDGERD